MINSNCLPNREANAADFKTQNINNSYVTKYTRGGKYGKQLVLSLIHISEPTRP